jgi:hypothetical protein
MTAFSLVLNKKRKSDDRKLLAVGKESTHKKKKRQKWSVNACQHFPRHYSGCKPTDISTAVSVTSCTLGIETYRCSTHDNLFGKAIFKLKMVYFVDALWNNKELIIIKII